AFREAVKRNGLRSLALGVTLAMPIAHFIYFKQHWHPGQYETHPATWEQFVRILSLLKGTMSLDYLALGLVLALVCLRKGEPVASATGVDATPAADAAGSSSLAAALILL